jgi:hypothetical protein
MRCVTLFAALAIALFAAGPILAQCDEQVLFDTPPGAIVCHHTQTEFNCCAWIDFSVNVDDFDILIVEEAMFEIGPCYCLCCFDNEITIGGLEPGTYSVSIWKIRFDGSEFVGTWDIDVDGESAPFLEAVYTPCVETTVDPELRESWGTIKALYR